MDLALITFEKIVTMFIILVVGVICSKVGLIDEGLNKRLSSISLMLISPILIFTSYQIPFDKSLMWGLLWSLLLAVVSHGIGIGAAYLFFPLKKENPNAAIERISVIYSNCGFIGVPLVNGLFGKEGVFYVTAYITIFNLLLWTQGVILMTGSASVKQMAKNLRTPAIIAIFLGIFCFMFRLILPSVLLEPLEMIASMNTPFAMIVAGAALAQSNLLVSLKKSRIYLANILKLLVTPLLFLAVTWWLPVKDSVLLTALMAMACPVGASGTQFALRYEKDAVYASQLFAVSTIFSVVTLPVIMMVALQVR